MAILKKQNLEKNVLELAYERLNNVFDQFDTVSVSFSGGKDSTACLNLTLEVARQRNRLPLDVIFFDEEAIPYQTEEYCRRVSQIEDINFRWLCLPIVHRNACSRKQPYWHPWGLEDKDKWVRQLPKEAITKIDNYNSDVPSARLSIPMMTPLLYPIEKYGRTAMILGIRADESLIRYNAVAAKAVENYIIQLKEEMNLQEAIDNKVDITRFAKHRLSKTSSQKTLSNNVGHIYKAYPIYDLKTSDVWTAPKKFNWDYNRAYDVMEKVGISHYFQRVAPPFGEEPIGRLWSYSQCFPNIWDKMCYRVKGVNTASRYAKSILYSNREQPKKPEGMCWEEYIEYWIRKFPSKQQGIIAKRIKGYIDLHYKKTKEPILEKTPHPITGISWKFLLKIAVRGDFKERKAPQPPNKELVKEYELVKSMYAKELKIANK